MRKVTATEKYRAVTEGQMSQGEFVRQMRLAFPQHVNQFNGYSDSVTILKNRGILAETAKIENNPNTVSDDALRRALDIELTAMGHDPVTCKDKDAQKQARAKALKNLSKDPLHYYNLLAAESSKVDKNDKMKETKRGKLEKDTFNDMKKATLKERKERLVEGTRALVGYLAGDRLTTTYNHYDGYPSHLGKALQMHYNDDDKAKEIAMKGYITGIDADTGDISATHDEKPGKLILPDDKEQRAREIAEEIDSYGAAYGYVWDDNANQWVTIKNTGIRSMIDQILAKLDMVNIYSGETMEGDLDETEEEYLAKKDAAIKKAMGKDVEENMYIDDDEFEMEMVLDRVKEIKHLFDGYDDDVIVDFVKTHRQDIRPFNASKPEGAQAIKDEFDEFVSVNYESGTDYMQEKTANSVEDVVDPADYGSIGSGYLKGFNKPHSLDLDQLETLGRKVVSSLFKGDFDAAKAKFVSETDAYDNDDETQAMIDKMKKDGKDADDFVDEEKGKDKIVKENMKAIISKILEEQILAEAATAELSKMGDTYGDFDGMKSAINALENIVTDIEQYYDKTRTKIQKVYDTLGEIRNEEGLKVGAFIAPAIESAFLKDLRPVTKIGFTKNLNQPKVKSISQAVNVPNLGETEVEPKQTVFGLNEKKK